MTRPSFPRSSLAHPALVSLLLVLAACSKGSRSDTAPASSAPFIVPATGGAVNITADEKGFTPTEIRTTKGVSTTLVFTRTSDNTCATEVVFPELKVRRPLPLNQGVAIEMPTQIGDRTYHFQCGMKMWEGAVVIK